MDRAPSSQSREPELFCPVCDYNLTGLPENRCPECGGHFDPADLRRLGRRSSKRIGTTGALLLNFWPALVGVPALMLVGGSLGRRVSDGMVAIGLFIIAINTDITLFGLFPTLRKRYRRKWQRWRRLSLRTILFVVIFSLQLGATYAAVLVWLLVVKKLTGRPLRTF